MYYYRKHSGNSSASLKRHSQIVRIVPSRWYLPWLYPKGLLSDLDASLKDAAFREELDLFKKAQREIAPIQERLLSLVGQERLSNVTSKLLGEEWNNLMQNARCEVEKDLACLGDVHGWFEVGGDFAVWCCNVDSNYLYFVCPFCGDGTKRLAHRFPSGGDDNNGCRGYFYCFTLVRDKKKGRFILWVTERQ